MSCMHAVYGALATLSKGERTPSTPSHCNPHALNPHLQLHHPRLGRRILRVGRHSVVGDTDNGSSSTKTTPDEVDVSHLDREGMSSMRFSLQRFLGRVTLRVPSSRLPTPLPRPQSHALPHTVATGANTALCRTSVPRPPCSWSS